MWAPSQVSPQPDRLIVAKMVSMVTKIKMAGENELMKHINTFYSAVIFLLEIFGTIFEPFAS